MSWAAAVCPPGIATDFYGRLAGLARGNGASLILDTHGDALRGALPHRPYLIRLNHQEAQELVMASSPPAAAQSSPTNSSNAAWPRSSSLRWAKTER